MMPMHMQQARKTITITSITFILAWLSPWILSDPRARRVSGFTIVPSACTSSSSSSFCFWKQRRTAPSTTTTSRLAATKKKKNAGVGIGNIGISNIAGGFGRKSQNVAQLGNNDDYAMFPALEPVVRNTLVPVLSSSSSAADKMTDEIYQRLDQIYGFSNFNYDDTTTPENGDTHYNDRGSGLDGLLRKDSTSMENSDLDRLLAAATGDGTSSEFTVNRKKGHELANVARDVSRLPPFDRVRVLHVDPLVLSIDNFFTDQECDRYIEASLNHRTSRGNVTMSRSPTVGKDAAAQAQRTSTTFYHMYHSVPELMSRASRLLGLTDIHHWEEPQTVRYRRGEKFTWHLDALGPMEQQRNSAGQRTATLLVYLTSLREGEGGATLFRDLGKAEADYLSVPPRKGSALLFFPAAGGIPDCPLDVRTLHAGQMVATDNSSSTNDKWIAQLWLRQKPYFPPTVPPGNRHADALPAIAEYCQQNSQLSAS